MCVDNAPILPPSGPLFRDVHHGKIQHLEQAVVGGKNGFGLCHLAKLAVKSLNCIGGIDQSPLLLRIIEIGLILSLCSAKTLRASSSVCHPSSAYSADQK